jgi:hypothetical protein
MWVIPKICAGKFVMIGNSLSLSLFGFDIEISSPNHQSLLELCRYILSFLYCMLSQIREEYLCQNV